MLKSKHSSFHTEKKVLSNFLFHVSITSEVRYSHVHRSHETYRMLHEMFFILPLYNILPIALRPITGRGHCIDVDHVKFYKYLCNLFKDCIIETRNRSG